MRPKPAQEPGGVLGLPPATGWVALGHHFTSPSLTSPSAERGACDSLVGFAARVRGGDTGSWPCAWHPVSLPSVHCCHRRHR